MLTLEDLNSPNAFLLASITLNTGTIMWAVDQFKTLRSELTRCETKHEHVLELYSVLQKECGYLRGKLGIPLEGES